MDEYSKLGVDVSKKGIEVFEGIIDNLYPGAFCVITKNPTKPGYGYVLHTDSAGSKPVQAYLDFRENGDYSVFRGSAIDATAMNWDDIICVGAVPILFIDYIAINPFKLPKERVLKEMSIGFKECKENLELYSVPILFGGGETADQPHQVKTIDVSVAVLGEVRLPSEETMDDDDLIREAITGERIQPGDVIVGLRSGGKTKWERETNSGIMSNGLTIARQTLMDKSYESKYPEIVASEVAGTDRGYTGRFSVNKYLDELGMTAGEALISPTRIYTPFVDMILDEYRPWITGMVHNTAGGQTKCLVLGNNLHYVKENLLTVDPIFHLIQREGNIAGRRMFRYLNMGTGFEIILDDRRIAEEIVSKAESHNLGAGIIGHVEKSDGPNKVTIHTDLSPTGKFHYTND